MRGESCNESKEGVTDDIVEQHVGRRILVEQHQRDCSYHYDCTPYLHFFRRLVRCHARGDGPHQAVKPRHRKREHLPVSHRGDVDRHHRRGRVSVSGRWSPVFGAHDQEHASATDCICKAGSVWSREDHQSLRSPIIRPGAPHAGEGHQHITTWGCDKHTHHSMLASSSFSPKRNSWVCTAL